MKSTPDGGRGVGKTHLKLRTVADAWSGGGKALTLKSGRPQKNKIII